MIFGQPGDRMFKLVLIGEGAVGKTSIRRRYMGGSFIREHLATIGVDFAQRYLNIGPITVRLVIWDLAGQPSFDNVRNHYYSGSSGIILVYSVVDRDSFYNSSKWLIEAYRNRGDLPPSAVIGNKIDLRDSVPERERVSPLEGLQFSKDYGEKLGVPVIFKETSALTGENINETFMDLTKLMIEVEDKKKGKK